MIRFKLAKVHLTRVEREFSQAFNLLRKEEFLAPPEESSLTILF